MKKQKLSCVILLFVCALQPIQAKESNTDTILLISEHIPYLIYVKITTDDTVDMHFIPTNMRIPLTCANTQVAPLSSLSMKDNQACIKTSVETFFDIQIEDTIYLHMDAISKATGISMDDYELQNISDLSTFFETVADNINLGMIVRYKSYIDSELSLSSYYKYYKMSKQALTLHYNYMHYLVFDSLMTPMDNTFYKKER